jgi:hypothetical protein
VPYYSRVIDIYQAILEELPKPTHTLYEKIKEVERIEAESLAKARTRRIVGR